MKAIVLISLISYCVITHAQAPQTSPEKFAEFIPIYPKDKMPNSKGINLKDSIANESIDEFLKKVFKK